MSTATSPTKSPSRDVLRTLGFTKLSDQISLYTPLTQSTTTTTTASTTDPTLLILCSWAFAQPRHIAKYITPYQALYPSTSILLIQNVLGNLVQVPDTKQYAFFNAAAVAVQSHISSTGTPRVLLHLFSNGGAHAAVQLSETCRVVCGGLRLPVFALVLDSAPGIPRYTATVHAMVAGVPPGSSPVFRWGAAVFGWLMAGTTGLFETLGVMEPAARKLYRRLHDPTDVFVFRGGKGNEGRIAVPRCYMFSGTDSMILEEDVVAHAELVRRDMRGAGLVENEIEKLVRMEEFVGTDHVNHVKGGAERYWGAVRETWERSQQS